MASSSPRHKKRSPSKQRRALVARSAARAIESLETRLHLSVSMDANGWTVVTPTPGVSKIIYVSSSSGSDANSGLSPSTPVATIAKAVTLIQNNQPDFILLKRGDTFDEPIVLNDSGLSAQEPMVVSYYGDMTQSRPVVDSGPATGFSTNFNNNYVDLIGIDFTTSTHNPNSPSFDNQAGYGLSDSGTSNLLVEDCEFSYFISDLIFQPVNGPVNNITVRRNEILDSFATAGHSQGLYAQQVTNLTIDENIFDHDGWNTQVPGGGATGYNQDCYLHSSNINCVITGNIFADAGSTGLQARAGGIVDDNLFVGDPYGLAFGLTNGATTKAGGASGQVMDNVILEPRVDTVNSYGIGLELGNLAVGGGTVVSGNIVAESYFDAPAIEMTPGNGVGNPQQEAGLNSLDFTNNIAYDWGYSLLMSGSYVDGTAGADGLTSVVIQNNDFQNNYPGRIIAHSNQFDPRDEQWSGNVYASTATSSSSWFLDQSTTTSYNTWKADIEPTAVSSTVPFVNPSVTIESYMASLGMPANEAIFAEYAVNQSSTNWNPAFQAAAVISYIQAGFTVDTTAPVAVATPPPDVTQLTYQTTPDPTFTINYTDNVALNATSVANAVVTVAGSGGLTIPVTLLGTSGSGTSISATYQLAPPNGEWTSVPYGTFVIELGGGEVADTSGNTIAAEPLGTFQVTVNNDANPPGAAATTPLNFAAVAGSSSIALSWSDPAGDQRSYLLERATDSGFTQNVETFPLTADATSYTDTSAVVGTTYYYELTAVNPIGDSTPTAPASAVILPPAPTLSKMILNDGNASRTAITSITLAFSSPVTVNAANLSLVQNPQTNPTPIAVSVANPSGDGRTWVISATTSVVNNALPDGPYTLTVHDASITDAFGQAAGAGDQMFNFTSADGPVVTSTAYYHSAPPHSLSFTFSADVSASIAASPMAAIKVTNSSSQVITPASYSWNAATLTATWTFAGALADGSYTAQLVASKIFNADGVHLDGNGDGIPGDNYTLSFSLAKPTLSASGAANVNVNAPYSLTLGAITDSGQASPQYLVHWGDGTTSTYSAAGAVTHTYTSALGAIKITIDVIDANGTHPSIATVNTSVNTPHISLSGNSNANPGVTYTLTLGAVTDPGLTVKQYVVHWGDGSSNTYTAAGAVTHPFTNSSSSGVADTITVDLVDNGGAGGSNFTTPGAGSLSLTVNPMPSLQISGASSTNAGGTYALTVGTPVDPGFTVSQIVINWGDRSTPTTVTPGTTPVDHTYTTATAPGSDTISVSLIDNSGTFASIATQAVIVNPAPTVGLSGNSMATAGANYALTLNPAVDPGQTVTQYTIHWGDGTPNTVTSTPGMLNHVYALPGSDTITVDVTDGTGTYTAVGSLAVTVNGNATLTLTGNANANVGGTYTLMLGTAVDPGETVSQYTVHWGDGDTDNYSAAGAVTHTYTATGPNTISVDLTDGTGTYTNAGSLAVTVGQPSVALTGNSGVFQGQSYTLNLAPTDLGGTPQQLIVHWGDGDSDTLTANGSTPITATHVYSTAQDLQITADLVDETGTFTGAGSLALTVASPPTLNISGASNANVGGTYSLSLNSVTDSIGTVSSYIIHWGDGNTDTATSLVSVTHVYGSTGSPNISVDLVDQNGTYSGAATLALTVNQPTVSLSGNSLAFVNQQYALTLSNAFDPGETVSGYTVHWGDGSSSTYGDLGTVQHTYTAAGPMTVSVDMTDGEGTYTGVATLPLTVAGTPTVGVSGNSDANVGGAYTLNLGPANDASGTPTQYLVHWGDGTTSPTTTLGALTHTYTTTGPQSISVDLTDGMGDWTGAGSTSVTVNSAPTIALTGNADANAGGTYTLNLGAVTDPGYTVSQYTVHWGDGASNSYSVGGAVTHKFTATGPDSITVDLTDPTGTFAAAGSQAVTVNSAPTIALAGNADANAGGTYTLNLGAVTDPGYAFSQYTVHWGDGTSNVYATGGAVTHTFTAAATTDKISVDLTDSTGTFTAAGSKSITVNPAPTIALSGATTVAAGSAYSLTLGAVTDPGYTVTQYTVHWGDGTTSTYTAGGVVTHTYSAATSAAITVDLTDSTGTFTKAGALNLTVTTANTSPSLFNSNIDIGSPKLAGSASYSNGTYTVTGEGVDIYNTSDQFHFYSKTTSGNTTISARVTGVSNVNSWSKGGVMIRNGTAANAAFADVVVTPAGYVSFQWRTKAGAGATDYVLTGKTIPQYVKLVRSGSTFSAYYSSNGTTWTQIGKSESITMSTVVNTGLAVTSVNTGKTCTATFTNVSVG